MISQIKHEIKMAMIRKRKLREYLETDLSLAQRQQASEEIESLNRNIEKLSDDLDREYNWRKLND